VETYRPLTRVVWGPRLPAPPLTRPGPAGPQPAAGRCLLPVGVLGPDRLTRRACLVRPATSRRDHPSTGPTGQANRLVGILHGCLRHRTADNELQAWPATTQHAA